MTYCVCLNEKNKNNNQHQTMTAYLLKEYITNSAIVHVLTVNHNITLL